MSDKNISIIGIGRLGICTALCLEHSGYNVLGVDIFPDYVEKINNKSLNSPEPKVTEMLQKSKNFKATTSIDDALKHSEIIFILVATPSSGGGKHYDHTTLGNVLMNINKRKVENKHIVIGCTVIPGYIKDIGLSLIKDCVNTTISYNPEFIAQGDIINGFFNPDIILIGEGSKDIGDKLEEIYKTVSDNSPNKKTQPKIHRMSPSSAEITKLSINCFITTKIAFANMIADVADNTKDADKYEILSAVGDDSRIGGKYLKPGYGFGGPCFPRDNRALGSYIEKVGIEPLIPISTDKTNKLHTKKQAEDIYKTLQNNNETTFLITGAGYKEPCSVPIIEESQKLIIGKYLVEKGIKVIVEDTKILLDATRLEYGDIFSYKEV